MSKRSGNFFEQHIEKIILAIVGLVCAWFLITHVFISPNCVEYENKKFSSGDIDSYINEQAMVLEDKLNRNPEAKQSYKQRVGGFTALIDSAISDIDVGFYLPLPPYFSDVEKVNRRYHIPLVGEISDVGVEHIRTVAYVPTEQVNGENVYSRTMSEPNDIDFITVEAKFDVAGLYERFYKSFAGGDILEEWRDPCLAIPVFAAVQLQRQEQINNGGWTDWQVVPRTRIDHRREMFEVIEDVEKLPAGGMKVRLLQFNDKQMRVDLLQPEPYQIASAKEEWFPPSLHKEFLEYQREIDAQEKREIRAAERGERERERLEERSERSERRADKTSRGRTSSGSGSGGGGGPPSFGGGGSPFGGGGPPFGGGTSGRRTPTTKRRSDRKLEKERQEKTKEATKTIGDVYKRFKKISIDERTNIAKAQEPVILWAHDDTVELGKSYRYKVRLGVFNPIAGTDQFAKQDKSLKSKAILWSEFSDMTETVDVPKTLYFFPCEIQEASEIVTVTVSRYVLGYWYSKDFMVKRGETIGRVAKYDASEEEEKEDITVPKQVDYTTGAILVDVSPVNDWSGGKNLRARYYFDMLHSFDGTGIEHIPVKSRYWTNELQVKFNEIKKSEKDPKKPLRAWGGKTGQRQPGMGPPGMGPPGMGPPGMGPPGMPGYNPGY